MQGVISTGLDAHYHQVVESSVPTYSLQIIIT